MTNISDFYYVVQFIVQQIFVYLRDLLFHKYYGQSDTSDAENQDQKLGTFSVKQFAMDFLAMSFICALSFLVAIFSSKYSERKARAYKSHDDETSTIDPEEDTLSTIDSWKASKTSLHGCGDADEHQNVPIKQISMNDYSRKKSCEDLIRPRKPFSRFSQSTQTNENAFHKIIHNCWLVRRTRSGRIYGKYPL